MGIDAQLLVRNPRPLAALDVRKLSRDLVASFGIVKFSVTDPLKAARYPDGALSERHALEIVEEYYQDGPTLRPRKGEQFIEVHVASRWYGKGYECGDLVTLIAVTEWLEIRIPGCEVWYGGDSSGVLAEPFNACMRQELFQHFVMNGHDPYVSYFGSNKPSETCAFCADSPMNACRFGPDGTGYTCSGCGLHRLVAHDGTKAEASRKWPDRLGEPK